MANENENSKDIEVFKGLENNPNAMVYQALRLLEEKGTNLSNSNNAFMFLLEYMATLTQSSINKFKEEMRKSFPTLATTIEELYPHLNNNELEELFAKPGSVTFTGCLYIMSMKQHALHENNYREVIIPKETVITASNLHFLLTNDIRVRILDGSESVEVSSIPNDSLISNNVTTILNDYSVNTDQIGNPYLKFPLPCKQVRVYKTVETIYGYESTIVKHRLTDKFYSAQAFIVNRRAAIKKAVNIKFTEEYLNSSEVTVFAQVLGNEVIFKLPNIITKLNNLGGELEIVVYETKGGGFLPLYNVSLKDIQYELGSMEHLNNKTILNGVQLIMSVDRETYYIGGSDPLTFEEVKRKLITNSFSRQLPVTEYDIEFLGKSNNIRLLKAEDNLSNRTYVANKSLEDIKTNLVNSIPDVFNNIVKIDLEEYMKEYPQHVAGDQSSFTIPSGTLFINSSGYLRPLTKLEITTLQNMGVNEKIDYLKSNKIFFNPFYYSIQTEYNHSSSKIYHFDTPKITSYLVRQINTGIPNGMSCNVSKYGIEKTTNGYRLYFELTGDENFSNVDKKYVNMQLTLKTDMGEEIYFKAALNDKDPKAPYWFIDIDTDLKMDGDRVNVTNGRSDVLNKYIHYKNTGYIHIYLNDPNRFDNNKFLTNEIDEQGTIVVVLKSLLEFKVGEELTYLWNRIYNTYGPRKYLTHTEDIPAVYKEDVYHRDQNGMIIYKLVSEGGKEVVRPYVQQGKRKGDPIMTVDDKGKPVQAMQYKKGDVILDSVGNPIIDKIGGIERRIECLMLEYEYRLGDDPTSKRFLESCIDNIYAILTNSLRDMNSRLLEKTEILYRGEKSTTMVECEVNGKTKLLDYNISLKAKIFVTKDARVNAELIKTYRKICGDVITSYISKNTSIVMTDVIEVIKKNMNTSEVKGITFSGILPDEDLATLTFAVAEKKLSLNKSLNYTVNKRYEVEYDIDIEVIKI